MKLYFTKQDASAFLSGQDEVETGFNYTDMHLVHKTSSGYFSHNSNYGDELTPSPQNYNLSTEMYAMYNKGTSVADGGLSNGLTDFDGVFGIVNQGYFILPVLFTSFTADYKDKVVHLEWRVANELHLQQYEVQYSADAVHFNTIGAVMPGKQQPYRWLHYNNAPGTSFYRVKSIEKTGGANYSVVVPVTIAGYTKQLLVRPNPVSNYLLNLQMEQCEPGEYRLLLYNPAGQLIFKKSIHHKGTSMRYRIQLPGNIATGTCYLDLIKENQHHKKILVIE